MSITILLTHRLAAWREWRMEQAHQLRDSGAHPLHHLRTWGHLPQPPLPVHWPPHCQQRLCPGTAFQPLIPTRSDAIRTKVFRTQELCESRGGRPGLPVPNSPYGLCGRKATLKPQSELWSCVKVEVAVLSSPSLIVRTVSVDVKQHWTWRR